MHKTVVAQQMAARVKADALELCVTNFAHLKGGVDVAVDVVLLFSHFDVLLRADIHLLADVGVDALTVREQVAAKRGDFLYHEVAYS